MLQRDINGDVVINIYDAILLALSFNTALDDPNLNPEADLNHDAVVRVYDAILLAANFGLGR